MLENLDARDPALQIHTDQHPDRAVVASFVRLEFVGVKQQPDQSLLATPRVARERLDVRRLAGFFGEARRLGNTENSGLASLASIADRMVESV